MRSAGNLLLMPGCAPYVVPLRDPQFGVQRSATSYACFMTEGTRRSADRTTRIVHASFATEEAVYGVILVAGMIVVAGSHGDSSWTVFTTVVVTVLVFWAAHVY